MSEIELNLVAALCEMGGIGIDVGAYKGEYSKAMINHCSHIYGFEPIPRRYKDLNKEFFKQSEVSIYPFALSDKNGRALINIPYFKNRFHKEYALDAMASLGDNINQYYLGSTKNYLGIRQLEIETRTLDSFNFENISFIKIDVEGHESSILKGGEKTITKYLPNMLIEIEERHNPAGHDQIRSFLQQYDYSGYFVFNNVLMSRDAFDVDTMQISPLAKIRNEPAAHIPGYVNNFIFIHKSKNLMLLREQLKHINNDGFQDK